MCVAGAVGGLYVFFRLWRRAVNDGVSGGIGLISLSVAGGRAWMYFVRGDWGGGVCVEDE